MTKEKFIPQGEKFWAERPSDDPHKDWNPAYANWIEDYWASKSHPHREALIQAIGHIEPFDSVLEVGCNCGPNISLVRDRFVYLKDDKLAGADVNAEAIEKAKSRLPAINWQVASVTGLPFPDKSFDIVFTDAVLIYVGPKEIKSALGELDRVARKAIVLVEWYDAKSETGVIKDYHWCRNYPKLLEKLGYKVEKEKLTEATWPSKNWQKNGYIFVAVRQSKTSERNSRGARASRSTTRSRTYSAK